MDSEELVRDFVAALEERGLPADAPLEVLLRHERNNGKMIGAFDVLATCRCPDPKPAR